MKRLANPTLWLVRSPAHGARGTGFYNSLRCNQFCRNIAFSISPLV